MRAAPKHKHIHEFLRHDYNVRVTEPSDAGSSSPEAFTLGRLLSCTCRPARVPNCRGCKILPCGSFVPCHSEQTPIVYGRLQFL